MPEVSRRAALLGGVGALTALAAGAAVAAHEGLLPDRHAAHQAPPYSPVPTRALTRAGASPSAAATADASPEPSLPVRGQVSPPPGTIPDITPGPLVSGSFRSQARLGAVTGWTIAYPPDAPGRLRVLVVLHGRGGDHTDAFGQHLGLDRFLAQAIRQGARPFAIASVDGGDHSFWHRRSDGSDAGAMVLDEFLPLLARRGLDVSRVGLTGVSMGGYGALWLATQLRAPRAAVVVAVSPALWHDPSDNLPGSFDDDDDFRAHDIFDKEDDLDGIPLRIDCGASDHWAPATRDLRAALTPTPAGGLTPGDHDVAYWRRVAPSQLRFVATHLTH